MNNLNKNSFLDVADRAGVSRDQAELMWSELQVFSGEARRFNTTNLAYYFGAMVIISAMTWFMTESWERFGGIGMLIVSVSYALLFAALGKIFLNKHRMKTVSGLFHTIAVCMTPLGVYGFQRVMNIWPGSDPGVYRDFYVWIRGGWFFMEFFTIVAGSIAVRYVKFPFLTAPIAFALWFMSMDITPIIFGSDRFAWHEREIVSVFFGALMIIFSFLIDRRTKEDYSFWLYLFGLMAFWGGLSLMDSGGELGKLIYCIINVFLILLSVLLRRRVFVVFGSLGVFGYFGHLSHEVFRDSLLFPVALSMCGLLIIFLGIKYQKNRERLESWLISNLPEGIRRFLPSNR